jgi:hypothetical protein
MWDVHYSGIEKTYAPSDVLYVRYEDFKNPKTRVQVRIISRIVPDIPWPADY